MPDGAALAHERQRLADAFALHLGAAHPRSAAALVGDVAYGLVPVAGNADDGEERAVRLANEFLDRVGGRMRPVIGIGPIATDLAGLAHARAAPTARSGCCVAPAANDASPGSPTSRSSR